MSSNPILIDPFDPNEPNPMLTNALDSSLWELYTQRSHYHSAVSTLARIFEEAFTKPNYALEDFLDHTYSTVCLMLTGRPPPVLTGPVNVDV